MRKLTQEEFERRANKKHEGKYDYSKAKYVNYDTKVTIICPEHGDFEQTPHRHLDGDGCPECGLKRRANKRKIPMETFLRRSNEVHHYKYNYKWVKYDNEYDKIDIICPIHGVFQQTMRNHMDGHGCPKCGDIQGTLKQRKSQEQFIKEATIKHNGYYDYSLVEYKGQNVPVIIICPKHGPFEQTPHSHLRGTGCPKCGFERMAESHRHDTEQFIEKALEKQGDYYDYSKVNYIGSNTPVCIICPEHGEFWQTPSNHLHGYGCPVCAESQLEKQIRVLLEDKNIQFEKEYKFEWLKNPNTSCYLPLDFYLPKQKIAIECHGKQHFEPIEFFGGQNSFDSLCERDDIKNQLCKEHGIEIFYFAEDEDYIKNYRYTVFSNVEELIKRIEIM